MAQSVVVLPRSRSKVVKSREAISDVTERATPDAMACSGVVPFMSPPTVTQVSEEALETILCNLASSLGSSSNRSGPSRSQVTTTCSEVAMLASANRASREDPSALHAFTSLQGTSVGLLR